MAVLVKGGKVRTFNGKIRVGGAGESCCCQPPDPCVFCTGSQPSLTVSGTGAPSPFFGCGLDGVFTFFAFGPDTGTGCFWQWQMIVGGATYSVTVKWQLTGIFEVATVGSGNVAQYGLIGSGVAYDLACVDGVITGTINVNGRFGAGPGANCIGQVATIAIG